MGVKNIAVRNAEKKLELCKKDRKEKSRKDKI